MLTRATLGSLATEYIHEITRDCYDVMSRRLSGDNEQNKLPQAPPANETSVEAGAQSPSQTIQVQQQKLADFLFFN